MADDEKLTYGFDLDNSGFKQGVDEAFDHLDKKEKAAVNKLVGDLKKAENASKGVNSAITTDTIDSVEKAMSYLKMTHEQAVAYMEKRQAKNAQVSKDSTAVTKQTEDVNLKTITETEQKKTKVVEEETKKRILTTEKGEEELLKILNNSSNAKNSLNKAKDTITKATQTVKKAVKAPEDKEYTNGDSHIKNSYSTKNDQKFTPNVAAERFVEGGVTDNYWQQSNGGMRTGSPTFRGDPVGGGWGSSDPRLNNMGAYKETQYISQHPDTRMSRRELSAHLVKLNYNKKLTAQAKARPMTDEEEYKYQEDQAKMQEWKTNNFWNMVKGKAKVLKDQTKKQTDDFYKTFAELNGMSVDEATKFINSAQQERTKAERSLKTATGSGGGRPPRKPPIAKGGAFEEDNTSFKGIVASLQSVVNSLDNVVKVFSENRIEKYYDNKAADENSRFNKSLGGGSTKTPEQLQDAYNNNAIKYVRSAAKYAKSPEDFERMTTDIQEVATGMKQGFQSSELLIKELMYARDKVKERTGPRNMSGSPKTEEQIDAERKKAATDLINDAMRTSKSLEELTAALDRADRIVAGEEAVPNRYNTKYNEAISNAHGILSGSSKLKNAGVGSPSAEDEVAITKYRESLSTVGRMFDTLKTRAKNVFSEIGNDSEEASKKTSLYFKNATRIASGIIISQAFYAGLNAIKNGIATMVKFNVTMESTQVAFEQMLGSAKQAKAMLFSVEDLAAKTPYTVDTAVDATKRLLAYGFKANEVIPVLSKLSDATAITGDSPDRMERLILALGQIKVKGKLAGQELRQLYDAGIPAADIIMKKKGWTRAQFDKNVSQGVINADSAIKMLLDGIGERFGGTAAKLNQTTQGLLSNIHDSLMFLGQQLFGGAQDQFKKVLSYIADKLADLRTISREWGGGGLLNAVVPKEFQNDARRAIGYFELIGKSLGRLLIASGSLKYMLLGFMKGSLIVIQPVAMAINTVSKAVEYLNTKLGIMKPLLTALGMLLSVKLLFGVSSGILTLVVHLARLSGLTGAISSLKLVLESMFRLILGKGPMAAEAIAKLGAAMKFLVSNPEILIAAAIVAAFYAIGKYADQLRAKLSSIPPALSGVLGFILTFAQYIYQAISFVISALGTLIDDIFGIDTSKILQPIQQDALGATDAINKYTDGINNATDATDGLADATKLFLASFDEVHQIEDNSGGSGLDNGLANATNVFNDQLDKAKEKADKTVIAPKFQWPKIPPFPPFPPVPPLDTSLFGLSMAAITVLAQKAVEAIEDKFKMPQLHPNVDTALKDLVVLFKLNYDAITFNTQAFVDDICTLFKLPNVTVNTQGAMSTVTSIFGLSFDLITGNLDAFIQGIETAFGLNKANVNLQGALNTAIGLFNTTYGLTTGNTGAFIQGLETLFGIPKVNLNLQNALVLMQNLFRSTMTSIEADASVLEQWLGNTFTLANAQSALQGALNSMNAEWNTHKSAVISIALSTVVGVVGTFTGLPGQIATIIANSISQIQAAFNSWKQPIVNFADSIPSWFSGIGAGIVKVFQGALDDVSKILNAFKPTVTIQPGQLLTGAIVTGATIISQLTGKGLVPQHANGAIIDQDQIVRVGEHNKREAIVPLENPNAMAPFARAVAADLLAMQGNTNRSSGSDGMILQVGTLIADDITLKNLAKKINALIQEDNVRKNR